MASLNKNIAVVPSQIDSTASRGSMVMPTVKVNLPCQVATCRYSRSGTQQLLLMPIQVWHSGTACAAAIAVQTTDWHILANTTTTRGAEWASHSVHESGNCCYPLCELPACASCVFWQHVYLSMLISACFSQHVYLSMFISVTFNVTLGISKPLPLHSKPDQAFVV